MRKNILAAVAALTLAALPAHAYIDPSTGSYILQILVAGFLGAMFALKVFWHRILGFFQGLTSRSRPSEGDAGSDESPTS